MQEREETIEGIRSDVAGMKPDIRRLNDKVDEVDRRLNAKIDGVEQRLAGKIDDVDKRLSAKIDDVDRRLSAKDDSLKDMIVGLTLAMEKGFGELRTQRAWDRVWWMVIVGTVLGVMARGFKWI